jgi:protein farnesyltransferase subunit beta
VQVAEMLRIKTPEVTAGVAAFLERCQTYEGGIGGEPGAEAHGGYAFCGIATHVLLDCDSRLDTRSLLVRAWAPCCSSGPASIAFMRALCYKAISHALGPAPKSVGERNHRHLTKQRRGWMWAQRWAVMRQGELEGGFSGRTNKLVDGCYSFWVGGVFPLLCRVLPPLEVRLRWWNRRHKCPYRYLACLVSLCSRSSS